MNLIKYLNNPVLLRSVLLAHFGQFLSDKQYILLKWKNCMDYKLDLDNPRTFNEKLQWLKLNDHNPLYTKLVDKYTVKDYVAKKIGASHVIPTLGAWDSVDDIECGSLPQQFVLKCNHDSGGLVICKDKSQFDVKKAIKVLSDSFSFDFYKAGREWPYKGVKRKVIAEKYLENEGGDLEDYKVHNFNGEPKFILLCRDRSKASGMTEDFYDTDWNHLDLKRPEHDNPGGHKKPEELQRMMELSKILSEGIPFVRTDFYIVNHQIYFGEMTFYPATGMKPFEPEEWDYKFGEWLELPVKNDHGANCFVA